MNDVGLTIVESVAKGAAAYKEPSKRNIGLLGQFLRGAAFQPTKITTLEDFNTIFGGQSASFFAPGIVKTIFAEAGNAPVTLYLARVVGSGASVATSGSVALSDSKTMIVKAAYKGSEDMGSWANGITAKLYSYGSLVKDAFSLVITYGDNREQFDGESLAAIQNAVNQVSKYVTIEFSGEITKLDFDAVAGTVNTTMATKVVTGTGTTFTSLQAGDVLFTGNEQDGYEMVGTIASIESDTSLTLLYNAQKTLTDGTILKRKDTIYTGTLIGGTDGTVSESDFYPIESTTEPKGLACFDGYDIQLLACTEYHSLSMAERLFAYVQNRKSAIGICNLPLNADEGVAELYANKFQTRDKNFMAGAYMGWGYVSDDNGGQILVPAIAFVLGAAYLRTPYLSGDFIHIPPGGVDSVFNTAISFIPARLSQNSVNKLVQQFSCNVIRFVEGVGFYVGSSRTYSTNQLYQSIHIRQQTSYYVRALEARMRFMEQKPNTPELKNEALTELYSFFKKEYDNGALERSVAFDKAYQGICDLSNNPRTQDRKIINIDVLWIPTECTESIKLTLQRNDGILTTLEE